MFFIFSDFDENRVFCDKGLFGPLGIPEGKGLSQRCHSTREGFITYALVQNVLMYGGA